MRHKRILGVILAILIIAGAIVLSPLAITAFRSHQLISQIDHLQETTPCQEGLKQVEPKASSLVAQHTYSNAAKEAGLHYLFACEANTGNIKMALVYIQDLKDLYIQEGHTEKLQQITYITQYMTKINNAH